MDYSSSDDSDYNTDDEEILFEQEEVRKINVVNNFKNFMDGDPDFYGIKNLNTEFILNILSDYKHNNKSSGNFKINNEQYSIFQDLHFELFGCNNSIEYYNTIANLLQNKMYFAK